MVLGRFHHCRYGLNVDKEVFRNTKIRPKERAAFTDHSHEDIILSASRKCARKKYTAPSQARRPSTCQDTIAARCRVSSSVLSKYVLEGARHSKPGDRGANLVPARMQPQPGLAPVMTKSICDTVRRLSSQVTVEQRQGGSSTNPTLVFGHVVWSKSWFAVLPSVTWPAERCRRCAECDHCLACGQVEQHAVPKAYFYLSLAVSCLSPTVLPRKGPPIGHV